MEGHTFRDYINEYKDNAENAQLNTVVNALGLDKNLLIALMSDNVDEKNSGDKNDICRCRILLGRVKRIWQGILGNNKFLGGA